MFFFIDDLAEDRFDTEEFRVLGEVDDPWLTRERDTRAECPGVGSGTCSVAEDCEAWIEKVLYPGILVTSQFQIWQPFFAGLMAQSANI